MEIPEFAEILDELKRINRRLDSIGAVEMAGDDLLGVDEIAELVGVNPRTITNKAKYYLPDFGAGKYKVYTRAQVMAHISKGQAVLAKEYQDWLANKEHRAIQAAAEQLQKDKDFLAAVGTLKEGLNG